MLKYVCMLATGLYYCPILLGQNTEGAKFSEFTARSNNETVSLTWQIPDSNVGAQHFIVERSKNGLQWTTVDTIAYQNTDVYTHIDETPFTGLNYYRIKTEDAENFYYSIIRRVYVGKIENLITIYPNPVTRNTNLRFQMTALLKGTYQAVVYNSAGNVIAARMIEHDGNNNAVTMKLPVLTSTGIYRLVLKTKYEFYKQIFLVQ